MLTPEQIAALRDRAGQITDPINDFLLEDIARRIAEAGQLTSTASYQVWRMQQMGLSQSEIKKRLKKLLKKSSEEVEQLLTQSAEVGYRYDLKRLPTAAGIPFEQNSTIQQIVSATVELALEDFTNLTQTIGMVDPHGNALPLQDVYRSCTDYVFKQVITGATDYNTAVRRATKNLVEKGVRVIDYESGVHTSVEAAVRRNIMGGLGLMQEQINAVNHDDFGCDGWEISAHANSAPDHEPIQGKQYTDEAYESLNNSLVRRIGTLNCGHAAFPIIMGVTPPQYTKEELEKFREDNEKGVTYDGKHYTGYEATQLQRKLERAIRKQKKRILVDEATGDEEKLLIDRIKLQRLRQEYNRFSKAAGLRTQNERLFVAGFGRKQAAQAANLSKNIKKDIVNIPKYDIMQTGDSAMSVEVTIDQFTPCLRDRRTGQLVDTKYVLASTEELRGLRGKGWKFNWTHKNLRSNEIYKLTTVNDDEIQGLVAIEDHKKDRAYHLSLAESAPHNMGAEKRYEGVGGHLFAIAAKKSADAGYGGFIFFEAKNMDLVKHYTEKFGAHLLGMPHPYSMIIDEEAAMKLLSSYTLD